MHNDYTQMFFSSNKNDKRDRNEYNLCIISNLTSSLLPFNRSEATSLLRLVPPRAASEYLDTQINISLHFWLLSV